jgi:molybdate/tungstate transport system substrate-binding protein
LYTMVPVKRRTEQAAKAVTILLIVLLLVSCRGSKPPRRAVRVFAAACLNMALTELEKTFEKRERDVDVRVEVSGSLVAARKVSEYKDIGDIVISADKRVISSLLIPAFADWQMVFLSNEIVLAYSENSGYAAEVDSANWPIILLRPNVRVARVDENLGPLGYQTLLVWKLADIHYEDRLQGRSLFQTLSTKVSRRMIRPDAAELLPVLGTEADYIFVYRSMAKDHNLKHILLPPEVNLSSPDYKDFYSRASVTVRAAPDNILELHGEPILFSLTIPRDAPNPTGAQSFIRTLMGPVGADILRRHGFTPLSPPTYEGPRELMPEFLRALAAPAADGMETAK